MLILQCTGDNLRGRSRAAIDHHHHRRALEDVTRRRIERALLTWIAALDRDDRPLRQECVTDFDRRVEHAARVVAQIENHRSEEHTSELQSLMRISYAVFCLKKKKRHT